MFMEFATIVRTVTELVDSVHVHVRIRMPTISAMPILFANRGLKVLWELLKGYSKLNRKWTAYQISIWQVTVVIITFSKSFHCYVYFTFG